MRISHPIILTIVLLLSYVSLSAQPGPLIDKGDKAFDKFNFDQAMYFYESAHDLAPTDPSITRKIADTYRRKGQLNMSAEWYRKTLELDPTNAQDMLFYAEALKSMEEYDEALYWYENYSKLVPNDSRAKSHLKDRFYYRDLYADTLRYEMKRQQINNAMPVISVSWFEDEKLLVSAINLDNKGSENSPYLDIYLCDLTPDNELIHPIKLDKKVNSKYHDGPAFYSFSQGTLYITRNNIKGGKPVRDKQGNVNLKIYEAKYANGQWSAAQEWKYNDNNYSNGHATLTKDGKAMYFVSTRPGGQGGSDIYVCLKTDNGWSEPENLGVEINTAGNEMFPFIGDDNKLYFASDGHAGLGGLDIFVSEWKNGKWQTPRNMGSPINTNHDDFALVYDKESDLGFFCSNRSGLGDDDVYAYKHLAVERMIVAGTIKAGIPNLSLAGERIAIKNLATGHTMYQRLDEFERFEISAVAGEQVEVYMLNAEYFDQNTPALTYTVDKESDDPYIYIGQNLVALTKVPSYQGRLTRVEGEGLAEAKAMDVPGASTNEEVGSKPADNTGSVGTTNSTTNSTAQNQASDSNSGKSTVTSEGNSGSTATQNSGNNVATNTNNSSDNQNTATAEVKKSQEDLKALEIENRYKEKIEEADELFRLGKNQEARQAYISASAMKPVEKYVQDRIATIDQILDEERLAQDRVKYEALISEADKLYESGKQDEAMNAYKSALEILLDEKYPKERIAAIEKEKKDEQYAKNTGKISKSTFDEIPPFIDLDGMDISNVHFDYNKALLRKADIPTLEKVAKLMQENPQTTLLIRAHCDSRGSQAYNLSLSMSRAMAVQGYLMQKGLKRDRFQAEWYGEQVSLNGCDDGVPCSEGEYELNRRCEFKLVEIK